jgi:hypothetical protein
VEALYQMVGHIPTPQQLSSVIGTDQLEVPGSETEELIAHVASQGGLCEIFEVPTGERTAVLTIIPLEYENLQRYGDVVFLDGTMVRNALEWTTFQFRSSMNPIRLSQEGCCLQPSRPSQFLIRFSGPSSTESPIFCRRL